MARSESGSDWNEEQITNAELEAFEDSVGELGDRVSEFLAKSDHTPADIEKAVREYDMPDPLEDRPAEEDN
ncbi:hypothetical protein [Halostagnicola kamekurae]|uniref:Uncharacterized protein n=1 Tax=Halostagnicola kamekurae TaxID=619731 RepID=A0A1I6UBZ1_9EURY|nr:hypothetical protein [Halostagnicola kamekurae]SFS98921.1 hypothetical protein SAMN04488556_3728 [Halostagnicola kamekurae]